MAIDASVADLTHEVHPHRVGAESEEHRMAEAEDSAKSPDEIHGDRQDRVAEILPDQADDIARQMNGRRLRNRQIEDRHQDSDATEKCQEAQAGAIGEKRGDGVFVDLHMPSAAARSAETTRAGVAG